MRLSPLEVLCKEENQEIKPLVVDQQAKRALLKEFYGEDVLDLNVENFNEGIEKVRDQAKKVSDYMVAQGLANFHELLPKFDHLGNEGYLNKPSVSKLIKEYMESMLYVYKTSSEENRQRFINKCKDRIFHCGPGTLTNLMMVYSELTLANQNIGTLIGFAKRQIAEQALLERYRKYEFSAGGFGPRFVGDVSFEIHHIPNLINAVAAKYGLVVKSKEEDQYIKDVPDSIALKVDNALNVAFSNNDALLTMMDGIIENICAALPPVSEHHHLNSFGKEIDDFFKLLGIKVPSNYYCVAEVKERGYAKTYKHNVAQIVRNLVVVHMQDAGIITSPEYVYAKQILDLESSLNDDAVPCITKELFDESENPDRDWKYICSNALPLDEEDFGVTNPFLYNARRIGGKEPIQWFIDRKEKIKGMNPLIYALEHLDIEIIERQKLTEKQLSELLFEVNKPESVTTLVKLGARLDALKEMVVEMSDGELEKQQCTPLAKAIQQNKLAVVKQILVELKNKKQNAVSKFFGMKGEFEKAFSKSGLLKLAASRDNPEMLSVVLDEIESFANENKKPTLLFELCCKDRDNFLVMLIRENKYRCFKVVLDRLVRTQVNFKNYLKELRNNCGLSYLHLSHDKGSGEIFEALVSAMDLDQQELLKICSMVDKKTGDNIFHLAARDGCKKNVLRSLLSRVSDENKLAIALLLHKENASHQQPIDALVKDPEKIGIVFESLKSHVCAIYNTGINFEDVARDHPKSLAAILKALKSDESKLTNVLNSISFSTLRSSKSKSIAMILESLKDEPDLQEKVLAKIDFNALITNGNHVVLGAILNTVAESEFLLRKCLFKHLGNDNFQSHLSIIMDQGVGIGLDVVKALLAITSKHEKLFFDVFDDNILSSLLGSTNSYEEKKELFELVKSSKFYSKFLEKAICVFQSNWNEGCYKHKGVYSGIKLLLEECKTSSNEVQEMLFKKWDESKPSLASEIIKFGAENSLVNILVGNESLLKKVLSLKSSDKSYDFVLLHSTFQFFDLLIKEVQKSKPALLSLFIEPKPDGSESFFMTAIKNNLVAIISSILRAVTPNYATIDKVYEQKDCKGKNVLTVAFCLPDSKILGVLMHHLGAVKSAMLCFKSLAAVTSEKCSLYASTAAAFVYENRVGIAKAAIVTGVSTVCIYAAISRGASAAMAA